VFQKDLGEKRAHWMTTSLDDYKKDAQEDEEGWENEVSLTENEIYYIHVPTKSWYYELKYYLTHGISPQYLEPQKRTDS
jgi:hypothetical protein